MLDYFRALLVVEQCVLRMLRRRTTSDPALDQMVAYRLGRVGAYREIVAVLSGEY